MSETTDRHAHKPIWRCPVCGAPLAVKDKSFLCINSHCYDISADGYVNLLLANRKHSREPGDSKEMLESRKKFLNAGYFTPLTEKITAIIKMYLNEKKAVPCVILDTGCGEGYFLDCISRDDIINTSCILYGIDISKYGIRTASRKNRNLHFAIGSIYDLPAAEKSVDVLINIFSPFDETEFIRVLKDDGIIISAAPGAQHLDGLKKILYENPRLHDEEITTSERLTEYHIERLNYPLDISNTEDILCLLKMTPYYYKTGKGKIFSTLETIKKLVTQVDFLIRIFKKTK